MIEHLLEAQDKKRRPIDWAYKGFAEETASESAAPAGGSIAAYMGALGAAPGTMVADLSSHKAGWDDRWEEFSDRADEGAEALLDESLHPVEDAEAFNRGMGPCPVVRSSGDAGKTPASLLRMPGAGQRRLSGNFSYIRGK